LLLFPDWWQAAVVAGESATEVEDPVSASEFEVFVVMAL
jgi:hypothetical protein